MPDATDIDFYQGLVDIIAENIVKNTTIITQDHVDDGVKKILNSIPVTKTKDIEVKLRQRLRKSIHHATYKMV